jgi:hypothetical protein
MDPNNAVCEHLRETERDDPTQTMSNVVIRRFFA